MIDAWLGAVAVALLAVAYVVVGARRRARHTATSAEVDATFAQRRHELEAEARGQGLNAATVEALEEELALDTLDEAAGGGTEHSARTDRPPLLHLLAGGLAVAALAVGLYALWGEPYAPVLAQASQLMQADGDGGGVGGKAAALGRLQEALVDRTRRQPNDADSWFFLAHLHMVASDYAAAASAFATLREIAGPSEQIDIAWAQASYLADGAEMSAATREVVDRALAANPNHPDLFELLAMDALRGRQFLTGARYLVRALGQPMADSRRRVLAETLALARARLDPQRPFIEATINIEGEPMPWLMVFARPADGGAPLAALRLPARKTQTVVLDAATSMDEAKSLASGGMVELVARLSETGDATAGPQAISAPVDAATQPRIELTLTRPRPARPSIALDVSSQEDLDAAVPIFIIARHPSRPGPPVAVRRLFAGDLPAHVELSDADAMLPGQRLSDLDAVQVVARASIGGTPNAQSGDFESDAATITPGAGDTTPLRIHRRLP